MILIDTNSLVVLIIGLIDEDLIETHKRTSIYTKKDFQDLLTVIDKIENLIVLPNIWTEVDNLLNSFSGNYKWQYFMKIKELISSTSEKYFSSNLAISSDYFINIGITDSLILELAKECRFIITSDSQLSDIAEANGIIVYDMIRKRNEEFQ
jgi:predicted nucleic acid-binding protein